MAVLFKMVPFVNFRGGYTRGRWHGFSRTYPKNHLWTCHLFEASAHTLSLMHMSSARWTPKCLWCVRRKKILRTHQRHWKVHWADDMCSVLFAFCWLLFHFQIPFQKLLICSYISLLPEISFFVGCFFLFKSLWKVFWNVLICFFLTFW